MKKLTICVGKHKAVIRFKNIPLKEFTKLRWRLVQQNIGEITEGCFEQVECTKNVHHDQTSNKRHSLRKAKE